MVNGGAERIVKGQEMARVLLQEKNESDLPQVRILIKTYLRAMYREGWQYKLDRIFEIHIISQNK